jgi:hypothetical protein
MNEILRADKKTLPSAFDNQMKYADKKTGISFAILNGSNLEYANIPTCPDQKFKYFFNPSKLTAEERKQKMLGKIIISKPIVKAEDIDDEP